MRNNSLIVICFISITLNSIACADLPEVVQTLVDANSELAERIVASPYYLEVQMSVYSGDETEISVYTSWHTPIEFAATTNKSIYTTQKKKVKRMARLIRC
jgi:hypothetical protein